MSNSLNNKNILITGASRGIGKRLAMGLAASGARVGLLARSKAEIDLAKLEIEHAGGVALHLRADVRDLDQMHAAAERMRVHWGTVDVLIAAAGIQGPIGPFLESNPKAWCDTVETNLFGVMNAIRYGMSISHDLRVCYVKTDDEAYHRLKAQWDEKFPEMTLHILDSPYRSISGPLLDFIDQVDKERPTEFITVIFPEFLTARWHHQLLHNQTAWLIKLSLIYKKNVIVTSVKYHLETT